MGKLPLLLAFLAMGSYGAYEVWQRMTACVAEIRADLLSPNAVHRAVLYGMDCKVTSGFDSHAALVPPGDDFRPERHPPFLVVDGDQPIALSWRNDRTLVVDMPPGDLVVHKQEDQAGIVHILYQRP
jgi:heme exporter protein D